MNIFPWKKNKKDEIKDNIVEVPQSQMYSVIMTDGTVEEYPENFYITDGKNCFACNNRNYHTHFSCKWFKEEMKTPQFPLRAFNIYDAEAQGLERCYECKNLDELFKEDD